MSRLQWPLMCLVLGTSAMASLAAEDATSDTERARHLEQMRKVASSIRMLADQGDRESAVKLRQEPVLRYADSTRQTLESTLWVWGESGRPAGILAVEYYPQGPKGARWLYEIASLSTERISAEREGSFRWAAKEPGLKLQPLVKAPAPLEKEARRMSQMKELRDRFTATEAATQNGRIELRPLVTPLLRYADANHKILDGAIFAFANGTNPEVLLVLEAHLQNGKAAWHYALVHMTGEAVAVQLDGQEVWQRPGDEPPAVRAAYVNGYIEAKEK